MHVSFLSHSESDVVLSEQEEKALILTDDDDNDCEGDE
jgi:hypothetical protein